MSNQSPLRQKSGTPTTTGYLLIVVGAFILLSQIVPSFFGWVKGFSQEAYYLLKNIFSWKSILIIVGLAMGFKRNFGHPFGWISPIVIGLLFMIIGRTGWNYILPIVLINVGMVILLNSYFAPKVIKRDDTPLPPSNDPTTVPSPIEQTDDYLNIYGDHPASTTTSTQANTGFADNTTTANSSSNSNASLQNNFSTSDYLKSEYIETTSIMSGSQKVINGKIRGGDLVAIMGGNDINLLNAQIDGVVTFDITQIMGGTTLIVPPHWQVINQITMFMGGIEDKRPPVSQINESKTLILKGLTIMGGVEIRSF
jgi:hypothetical protein